METKLEEDIKSRIETTLHELIEANTEYLLEEKRDGGKMKLEVISDNQCLVIKNMEKHRLGIFQNKKCADHIVFEYIGDRKWNVHIIEMKKAVTNQKWDGIKKQFEGALINTLALNGYFESVNYIAPIL